MAWQIEFDQAAVDDLNKLGHQERERILVFLKKRVSNLEDPRSIGEALEGGVLGGYWKYRVGDYRIITSIEDVRILIVVLRLGHRNKIYTIATRGSVIRGKAKKETISLSHLEKKRKK